MTKKYRAAKQLSVLHTPLGVRSVYDSVCFCNRCGMCAPVCAAYREKPQESTSPRGRNQALRLLLERKLNRARVQDGLLDLLTRCSLCGRCTQHCPAQIPTAEHMLELRRRLQVQLLPRVLFWFLQLRQTAPRVFAFLLQSSLWAHYFRLARPLAVISTVKWLKHACDIVPHRRPERFRAPQTDHPTLIYLPSLEAEFILPQLAKSVYRQAAQSYRVTVWENTPCGLLEYVYGDLQRARRWVRKLITRHARCAHGQLPLVTDSADVYYFLKKAPQLFEGFPAWQQKASHFAQHVRFVTELSSVRPAADLPPERVTLLGSALFCADGAVQQSACENLHILFKKNFVKCDYTQPALFAGGYGFIKNTHAPAYAQQAVQALETLQVQTVFVVSGLTALELAFYCRRCYKAATVKHIAQWNG